ncbi:transporter substrate-binding domain-containing protein [Peptostreptococcus faecalis]|uniref:transporter substrate-binding domain-containing protein n=1 Tax=Peptostreptococcus faecalis TaxID=2045015 RepID=UPI000C7B1B48|nr:transporter substrate-binding domain-containing protein [Peptostreptococcus faecalis]
MKKIKIIIMFCIMSLLMVGCQTTNTTNDAKTTKEEVIRVGTSLKHFPFTYEEDGKKKGFEIDVWNEISKRLDKKVVWEVTSFDGLMGMLDSEKIDVIANQMSITPEREEKYKFSEIYAYNPYKIYVKSDRNDINSLEDLYGKKFVCNSTGYEREFISNFDKDKKIDIVIMDGNESGEVNLGRADAGFESIVTFPIKKSESGYDLKQVGDVVYQEKNAYPFSKKVDSKLYDEINKVIKEMHEDGTLTKISKNYFDQDITKSSIK